MDDDGVHALACGVIAQACIDVLELFSESGDGSPIDQVSLNGLREFFYGDWCAELLREIRLSRYESVARVVRVPDYGGQEAAQDEYLGWDIGGGAVPIWRAGILAGPELFNRLVYDRPFRRHMRKRLRNLGQIGGIPNRKERYNESRPDYHFTNQQHVSRVTLAGVSDAVLYRDPRR